MKSIAEKVQETMQKCIHFNGVMNQKCKAGVEYRQLFGSEPGWGKHLCCLNDSQSPVWCDKASMPTQEQAEAIVADREARFQRVMTALVAAADDAERRGLKKGNGGYGRIKCPNCPDGTLSYSVASINGHMHGQCSTPHCASWMQ